MVDYTVLKRQCHWRFCEWSILGAGWWSAASETTSLTYNLLRCRDGVPAASTPVGVSGGSAAPLSPRSPWTARIETLPLAYRYPAEFLRPALRATQPSPDTGTWQATACGVGGALRRVECGRAVDASGLIRLAGAARHLSVDVPGLVGEVRPGLEAVATLRGYCKLGFAGDHSPAAHVLPAG